MTLVSKVIYDDLFANMREAFFVCEIIRDEAGQPRDLCFLEVNAAYCALTGRRREDLVGHAYLELFLYDANFEFSLPRFAQVAQSGQPDHFEQFAPVTSRYFDIWAYSAQAGQCAVMMMDITGRKQAEEAVRQSEERFKTLFMSINEGFYLSEVIYDENGDPCDYRYLEVNPKFEQILGLSRDQVIGKRYKELVPVDTTHWLAIYCQVARTGMPSSFYFYSPEYRMHFETYAYRSSPGQVTVFVWDITERKQAEMLIGAQKEQLEAQNEELTAQNEELVAQGRALAEIEADLQQINRELETRIETRSEELRAANADLQSANTALLRANRLKSEFLANMSHELRTPLTGILGLAEVMENQIYGPLTDEQARALQKLRGSGEHLLELINDILDLSKVEAGRLELQLENVEVEAVCRASLEFIQPAAVKKNIRLSLRRDHQAAWLTVDHRRLKQMLANLLSNAVKFTPEGGQVRLEVEGDAGKQEIRFAVRDTGIGIPAEQQSNLFQPFVQLDGSLARQYEGTGLGLALTRSLAERHGGRVTAESAGAGQGACFTITLPWLPETGPKTEATDQIPANDRPKGSLAEQFGRPPVILAADDNPTTLTILSSYLEARGCRVIVAQNGVEALAHAQAARPDLILLDIHMPDLDGLAVLGRLRAAGSAVPVVALTALAMPEDRERCLAAGANEYLSKPMRLNELARIIARLLKLKEPVT